MEVPGCPTLREEIGVTDPKVGSYGKPNKAPEVRGDMINVDCGD